jgi:hypothetical protein
MLRGLATLAYFTRSSASQFDEILSVLIASAHADP